MKNINNRQNSKNNGDLTNDTAFDNSKKIIDLHLENFFNKYFKYPDIVDFIDYKEKIEKTKKEIEEKFIEDESFTKEQKESLRLLMNEKIVTLETIKLNESENKKKEKIKSERQKDKKPFNYEKLIWWIVFISLTIFFYWLASQ